MMKLFKIWCSRCHTECIDIYSAITSFPIFLPNQPMLMLQYVCRIQCGWGLGDWTETVQVLCFPFGIQHRQVYLDSILYALGPPYVLGPQAPRNWAFPQSWIKIECWILNCDWMFVVLIWTENLSLGVLGLLELSQHRKWIAIMTDNLESLLCGTSWNSLSLKPLTTIWAQNTSV